MAVISATMALVHTPVVAEEVILGKDPISVIMDWSPRTEAPIMPVFVQRTRPPEEAFDYTPLSGPTVVRPPIKTPVELAESMKRLDGAVRNNKARAGRDFQMQSPPPSAAANAAAIKRAQEFRNQ